jgi:hypothetical protein
MRIQDPGQGVKVAMNTERFARHHEAREALVLSVAGVTAIMLIANLLFADLVLSTRLAQTASRPYGAPLTHSG